MVGLIHRAKLAIQVGIKIEFNIFASINENEKLKIASEIFDRMGTILKNAILKLEQSDLLNKAIKEL